MASTLRRTSRSACDADCREQRADGRRDQAHEQRHQDHHALLCIREHRERLERHCGEQEDDRETGEQDVERDLVRCLLTGRALDQRDHPIEERLTGTGGDAYDDLVGQHTRPARDRRPVTARLADDRRGLAGDRRFVDARDAVDHVAVARDELTGAHDDFVIHVELRARHVARGPVGIPHVRNRLRPRATQRVGLSLAPALGDRLSEVREQHGEPQEQCDEAGEDVLVVRRRAVVLEEEHGRQDRADTHHEHHRVAH
jgi:hypothetical protein